MHIEILVEEPSAEAALLNLVPAILGSSHTFKIHPHSGKPNLLKRLPERLRGYRAWLPSDWAIVVLVDADSQDCRILKAKLERMAEDAGLATRGKLRSGGRLQVLNRLAIEEFEAWFFGDVEALQAAFPRVPRTLASRQGYRDPDAIRGGTWERLERELQRVGHCRGGLAKVQAARSISRHMDPDRNRSRSFQAFRDGLRELAG